MTEKKTKKKTSTFHKLTVLNISSSEQKLAETLLTHTLSAQFTPKFEVRESPATVGALSGHIESEWSFLFMF